MELSLTNLLLEEFAKAIDTTRADCTQATFRLLESLVKPQIARLPAFS
jgi:hypothetical protein